MDGELTQDSISPDTDNFADFEKLYNKAPDETEKVEVVEKTDVENEVDKEKTAEPEKVDAETDPKLETEDSDDTPPPQEEKPKKKTFQDRIDELTARAREAERREAEALRRIQEAESKSKTTPATPEPTPSKEDDSPKPDAKNEDGSEKYPLGEFDPDYIRDLTRHTIQKETAAARESDERERLNRQHQEARDQLQTQWAEKLSTVTETHEDFLDKTMELESAFDGLDPQYSDYLVQTIKSLDHGPEVLYHFANNLDEAKRFVRLGPLAATLALGEINAKFKTSEKDTAAKPEPRSTQAPTPPPTNRGTSTRKAVAADTDDLDDFMKLLYKKKR